MKLLHIPFVILSAVVFISGCKLHVIVPEGGEVQPVSEELYTCGPGSECIFDLEEPSLLAWGEAFLAVPDSGWYFHKWKTGRKQKAGHRYLCGGIAFPQCYLGYEGFEDDRRLVAEIFDPSQNAYLMPVFKRYPRASLGDEPRTIMAEGVNQLWLEPADFAEYTPDQVVAVCPEGICSGTLPGSSIDLSGHFWASRQEVSLLFLAYHQADESIFEHFEIILDDPGYIAGALRGKSCGEATTDVSWGVRYIIHADYCDTGYWFWKPLE